MTVFLLELRSEEIPARMQVKAKEDLARLFAEEIAKAGLHADDIETFATPRRLALIARGLPVETAATSEERKGPRANAPEAAVAGFLRSTGLERDQLTERDGVFFAVIDKPGRSTNDVLAEAIPAIVRAFPWPKSMRWGAASTTTESLRWVRPLQGIVALFGDDVVPCEIDGIASGAATLGHRFHHPGVITIGSAADYVEKLRACHVVVHLSERLATIRDGARAAAVTAGLVLVEDEGLVLENAGLAEWPVPLLGRFDATFLDVPREVIQLTMRTNQKYFACTDASGALANAFVCTANIDAVDPAGIVDGNRKVLAARLADAKFFWEADLKVPLADQADKLRDIVFHEKLGTVADKVERVAKLARWLCEEGIVKPSPSGERDSAGLQPAQGEGNADAVPHPAATRLSLSPEGEGRIELAALAERAARLCKADLVTGMVGEFPELQGIIGGHLALAQGEDTQVADAIRDHYKPVGQGNEVPTAPVTVAVSLADKLDSIAGFFGSGQESTGSKDPFALRRSALGVITLITSNDLRLELERALKFAGNGYVEPHVTRLMALAPATLDDIQKRRKQVRSAGASDTERPVLKYDETNGTLHLDLLAEIVAFDDETAVALYRLLHGFGFARGEGAFVAKLLGFFADRLKVQQREAGVRHDLIDAVFALGGEDDLVRLLARVRALQAFVGTEDGANLLAGYKRAANILKKEGHEVPLPPSREGLGEGSSSSEDSAGVTQGPSPHPSREGGRGDYLALSHALEPPEAALIAALDSAEPRAATAIERGDFEGAMMALSELRAPIDGFFAGVMVNDPHPAKRSARLALLARFRDAVHRVADFSRIEG